jgi:hypothetical protein
MRPSELVLGRLPRRISDVSRFWYDRAVWLFGASVEADIQKHTEKCKTDADRDKALTLVLDRWLDIKPSDKGQPIERGMFADPASRFQKG